MRLTREMTAKILSLYLTKDKALPKAMIKNHHVPHGSRHLFKLVSWSTLLLEKYKKNHIYTELVIGKLSPSYLALLDSKLSPLTVNDSQLQNLPLTYILTCECDFLRDYGLMYISQLQNVGVKATHDHID